MHKKLKQVSVHLQTHAHTRAHTYTQSLVHTWAWHRPGTMWDTPRHMHTGLDRQAAGCVSRTDVHKGKAWLRAACGRVGDIPLSLNTVVPADWSLEENLQPRGPQDIEAAPGSPAPITIPDYTPDALGFLYFPLQAV